MTVVVHGPAGSGKTANAARLAEHYGCETVVDDWSPFARSAPPRGALLLTRCVEAQVRQRLGKATIVPIADALAAANDAAGVDDRDVLDRIAAGDVPDDVASQQLRQFVERIERLEEERRGIAIDVKDVYAEAKGQGFDRKTMRTIVRLRSMDKSARDEADALLETYRAAMGLA